MTFEKIQKSTEEHFSKSFAQLQTEFRRLRTGRANPALIEHVQVDVYSARTPLTQVASVTATDAHQLTIKPWDKSLIKDIEKALVAAELGMSPQNDGIVIRLNIPPLSTERRKQLGDQAKQAGEKCKVAMRNIRRDAMKDIETFGKANKISEDLIKKASEKIQTSLKEYENKAEAAVKEKMADLMSMS